ncbi:MAG: hypothetical protein II007_07930 [Gammaproteobacteria bacterium]|nr:hypothetical protein [Gammaproteobacteria bacterium]
MSVLKNLFLPHGGLDFRHCEHAVIDCGSAEIELAIPRSTCWPNETSIQRLSVDLGHAESLTYETRLCDKRTLHPYVKLALGEWFYLPPRLDITAQGEPYVCATGYWRIERTKQNIQMERGNLQRLTQYLKDDYAIYFEQEGDGKDTCGPAWRVKKRLYDFYSGRHHPVEFYASEIKEILAEKLPKLPDDYTEVTFGNTRWVRYCYVPHRGLPTAINYSLPLDANHLLTISISLVRFLERDEKWLARARADFDRLVAGTQVHFRQLTAPQPKPLLTTNDVKEDAQCSR